MSVRPCRRVLFRQRGQWKEKRENAERRKQASSSECVWEKTGSHALRPVYMLSSPFVELGYSISGNYDGCVTGKERICKNNMNGP